MPLVVSVWLPAVVEPGEVDGAPSWPAVVLWVSELPAVPDTVLLPLVDVLPLVDDPETEVELVELVPGYTDWDGADGSDWVVEDDVDFDDGVALELSSSRGCVTPEGVVCEPAFV